MNKRRNIGILVALMIGIQAMVLVVAQSSYGYGYVHRGGYHGGYYRGGVYVNPYPYYGYNAYDYRGYPPYVGYGYPVAPGVGLGVAVGALVGGLVARPHTHIYAY